MSRLLFLTLSLLSLATLSAASPQDSGLCQVCQVAVGVQQMQLKMATGSLEQADQFIRQLCQSMKNPEKHRCILWLSDMERNTTWFMNTPPHEICKTWMKDECDTTTTTLLKQRQDDPKCMTCYMMGTVIGVTEKMNISRDNLPSIFSSICQLTHTDPCPMDKLDDMINEIDAGTAIDDMCHHESMCENKLEAKKKPHDQTMCGICQLIVGSEQMQLKLAEGSLRDADKWVHNLCSSMSDPHQRYDCFQLVKKLENDVTWLMSTDASTVCSALYDGVCDNVKPLIEMKVENDHPECMTCHIMGTVIYATEALNMSRDGLPNIFNTICSITGMSQCPLDKLDDMIQTIDNGASVKDMCIKEGLCGGGNKHVLIPKPQDNALCQMCQVVVNVEQIALKLASGVLQAADDFAKSACHMLQNPQQQQCLDFIANVERNTTWFMINTPQVICRTWFSNICANTPALEIVRRPPPRPVPVSCVACEIMGSLITVTETFKLPRDNLQSTFSTICALTKLSPCPLSKLPSMILAIDLGISVNDMCINEKLCAPSRKGITVTQPAEKNAVVTTSKAMVPPSIPCQICQLVAIITQFWLKLASGPIQILNEIIVAICNSLQGSTRDACNNWISKVAQDEEWILANSPETVCAVWVPQVCGGGMRAIMAVEKYEDTTCTSCRLMTRLAQILPNMDTQDTYEVMRKLAVIFHIDMQEMMDLIPIMISMRNQGFSEERADALCVHQHMCYGRAFIAPPPKHSSTSCSVCSGLMSTLQAAHRSNHPVQGFMRSLTIEICLHLGGSVSTSCLQLLDEISHDETIMKLSPQQICSNFLVQSCDSPIPPQQLLLGSKPQTSMISMDHALLQPQAISCSTCHLFATLMSVISESNPGLMEASADQWIAVLHNVCSEYADHVRCQALSDYVPTMMRWQERGFNTIQMCQYVEACPAWE